MGQGATQGIGASAYRQSTLEHATLTVLMHDRLLWTGTRTCACEHKHTQKIYIAGKWAGQELRAEILQTAHGGWGAY